MEEAKERLMRMMEDFESDRKRNLREKMFVFGERLNGMNNPVGRFIVSNITTKFMGNLIVRLGLFGVERRDDMSLEEIALNWLKPSLYFNIPAEIGEVTEDSIEIFRPECTIGFDRPEQCKICRASMGMDMEIIRLLGGKLTVTETILEGAPKCRHIIEKR